MNVKIVLFSKRLYNFNISKDLSHFVIQNRKLYIGCLQDDRLIEVKKDNDIYLSTFSDDNSSVVIKDYKKLFYLCDNFNKEINIRRSTQSMYFDEEKPLVYKGFIFSFFKEFSIDTIGTNKMSLYRIDKTKKRVCWSADDIVLIDSKIYNDCLYAVFSKEEQGKKKTQVLIHNLITEKNKLLDLPFSMGSYSAIIPQKKLIVSEYTHFTENYSVLKYYSFDTCEIVYETKLNIMTSTSFQLEIMCNGKYLIIPHTRGVIIFDNEEFLLKKEICFTLPRFVYVCDNDNYCCIASYGDCIVFSLSEFSEDDLLSQSLHRCLEKNMLGHFMEY